MKKHYLSLSRALLFVLALSTAAIAAEMVPAPKGYDREFTNFHAEIAAYDLADFFQKDKTPFIGFIGNDL